MTSETIVIPLLSVISGLLVLTYGADRFVIGASATARRLGVSPLMCGLIIAGFGTSAPEMLVAAVAALDGKSGLALGNAVGSNIANIGLVLGVTALVTPLVVDSRILKQEYPLMFASMLLVLAVIWDGRLGRVDDVISGRHVNRAHGTGLVEQAFGP